MGGLAFRGSGVMIAPPARPLPRLRCRSRCAMASAAAQPFHPPAIPWRQPRALESRVDLGPGLDVLAVLAFGSRARGDAPAAAHTGGEGGLLASVPRADRSAGGGGGSGGGRQRRRRAAERLPLAWVRGWGPRGEGAACRRLRTRGGCWRSCAAICAVSVSAWIVLSDRQPPRAHDPADLAVLAQQPLGTVLLALLAAELERCERSAEKAS